MSKIKMGLWDMKVKGGDVANPNNPFEWSQDFRQMLGFKDSTDFPNVLNSWSDRLHPDHKEATLQAFSDALNDTSGMTIYDVEYLLKRQDGTYSWYRAAGEVQRDASGTPLRIVGYLHDIAEQRSSSDDQSFKNNASF